MIFENLFEEEEIAMNESEVQLDRRQLAAMLKESGNNLKKIQLPETDSEPVETDSALPGVDTVRGEDAPALAPPSAPVSGPDGSLTRKVDVIKGLSIKSASPTGIGRLETKEVYESDLSPVQRDRLANFLEKNKAVLIENPQSGYMDEQGNLFFSNDGHESHCIKSYEGLVSTWVTRIDALLKKIEDLREQKRRTVFEIGELLIEAKVRFDNKDFRKVVEQSGLKSKSNAENYMRVASKTILRKPEIEPHLPKSVGALIDVAAWPDEQIQVAVENKVMKPDARRNELRNWYKAVVKGIEKPQRRSSPASDVLTPEFNTTLGHLAVSSTFLARVLPTETLLLVSVKKNQWTDEEVNELLNFIMIEGTNKFNKALLAERIKLEEQKTE
jgi:hypothetical protein